LASQPVSKALPRAGGRAAETGVSAGAVVLAGAIPLLFLHVRYQPDVSIALGGTEADVTLSDAAVLAVALAALATGMRAGFTPLRRGLPVFLAAAAFLAVVFLSVAYPVLRDEPYDWQGRLVTAAKFAEYAVLALAVPLLLRHRASAALVLRALVVWSCAATAWAILQFAGAVSDFIGKRPGQREPSFLGIHDFAMLSAAALTIALLALFLRSATLVGRAWAIAAGLAGALGIVLSGAMTAVVGLGLAATVLCLVARRREKLTRPRAATGAAIVLAVFAGTSLMRSSDIADFAGFLGLRTDTGGGVESYAHRTLLGYIGLKIFLDHPLTGVGWQGSSDEWAYAPQLDAARRRFPEEPAEAFPSPEHPWGVQNAYVQTGADLGVIGFGLLAVLFVAALAAGLRASGPGLLGLLGVAWLLVAAGIWNGLGLFAGIPLDALTWLAFGLATTDD